MGKVIRLYNKKEVDHMLSVYDVAKTFLYFKSMTHKKLQKLCYYAQAWHLALLKKPLVDSDFEAWIHGPVCPELYEKYRDYGYKDIPVEELKPNISQRDFEFIKIIYDIYGNFTANELEQMTHHELPWKKARKEIPKWMACRTIINPKDMEQYYWMIYKEKSKNITIKS